MDTSGTRGSVGRNMVGRCRARAVLVVAAGALAATAAPATAATPVGEWAFDEPAGQTVRDGGPHGLDGRLGQLDDADAADPTRIPGALRFDGSSFVRLPDASALAPTTLSVEAVVRAPATPGTWRYVVSRGGQGCFAGAYGLYTATAGGMAFYVFDGSGYIVTATARPGDVWDGAWHHVTGTFDGGELRLYVDGRPVGDAAVARTSIDYASTSASMAFGRYVGSCDLSYRGDLDLVRLSTGALTPAEVAASAQDALRPEGPLLLNPLPAAAPPTRIDASPPAGPPAVEPGAPQRACGLRISRKRITVRRRTTVRVRVTLRGEPVRAVRVVATRRGTTKPLAAARTGASGRVRLVLRPRRTGRVKVSAAMTPSCPTGYIRVAKRVR